MNLSMLSIRRPIFITCLTILLLAVGYISLHKIPVNLFPDVSFPIVLINTSYMGASPEEIETLVTKIIEDEINTIPGIKQISSENMEGRSQVVAEFTADTDSKYAEQQIRDKLNAVAGKLPKDVQLPVVKRIDPADKPILILSVKSTLSKLQLYELAEKTIKPKLEQINQVGMVEILGGSGREVHVDLDRNKLQAHDLSVTGVANRIAQAGENVPIGKIDQGKIEKIFRAVGEYHSVNDIGSVVVNFLGNDIPVTVDQLGTVADSFAQETSKTYVNGHPALIMMLYQQTGSNTIEVVNKVKKKLLNINAEFNTQHIPVVIDVTRDGSKTIQDNVNDVVESIVIGIFLTLLVVYLFLGSLRSTFITGLAIPTSIIGSFLLMHLAGFSINTMSLLALSLTVGLLVDDAIVVRENIFRHGELGKKAKQAAIDGTKEVFLAVVATTLTVVAVFGPIGFLHGIVGSFFKEFGLTVCFAMLISLFDALAIAPMLCAYIGLGKSAHQSNLIIRLFQKLQTVMEHRYEKMLKIILHYPITILLTALLFFLLSMYLTKFVPKTFLPTQDNGEFVISLELPPGTNLQAMNTMTQLIDAKIRSNPEIATAVAIVGSRSEPNHARFFINMVPSKQRTINTSSFKQKIRQQLKQFPQVKVSVKDIAMVGGGGEQAFNLILTGNNLETLKPFAFKVFKQLKSNKQFLDPEISYKDGKPEVRIIPEKSKLQQLGVTTTALGQELRAQVEGTTAALYRENGQEYNIIVRLKQDQRDLEKDFNQTLIPNLNNTLVKLDAVAKQVQSYAPSTISRKDRARYLLISADIAANGPGLGDVMKQITELFETTLKPPPGITYSFVGQAESFNELTQNMTIALGLSILFIYLVLSSLYESFITPFTIMLALPLAACGAVFGLLVTGHSLDIFSMIGSILLLGIATKNSILLVDYIRTLTLQGVLRETAIVQACKTRLRPIIMTTVALIVGMIPIAIGLNEASKQRTSMGIAVIGGLISSTVLTLFVIPAVYSCSERFKVWFKKLLALRQKTATVVDKEPPIALDLDV